MTIQGFSYLVFLLGVWLLARLTGTVKARQTLLLAASLGFYASWGSDFLAVLLASAAANYGLGKVLRRHPSVTVVWTAVLVNLGFLALFKYLPAATAPGMWSTGVATQLFVPVGISFWIFQGLSYLFDVYRGEPDDPSFVELCLYLTFWPTVLAGPVCRLPEMLPQFRDAPRVNWDDVAAGGRRIVIGLFMKTVLAQTLEAGLNPGEGVMAGFDQIGTGWGAVDVWLLAIGFGFQLFFDFAGYSHIVIGSARLFGLRLPENFERPFLAPTPSAFWTRWHMSLSSWIRDYVFLSLVRVRRETWWRYLALLLAMGLFGLWHGATATFVLWGGYHGVLLVAHRLLQAARRRSGIVLPMGVEGALSWLATFGLVSLGWVLFRAHDLRQALVMLGTVVSPERYALFALRPNFYVVTSMVIVSYFLFVGLEAAVQRMRRRSGVDRIGWLLSPAWYAAAILLIIIWSKQTSVFVYFQF